MNHGIPEEIITNRRPGTIAHTWSGSSGGADKEEIHEFVEEPFELEAVVVAIDADASISVDVRLVTDNGDHIFPDEGKIAGGQQPREMPATHLVHKQTTVFADWSNGDGSAREFMIVLVGNWLELEG